MREARKSGCQSSRAKQGARGNKAPAKPRRSLFLLGGSVQRLISTTKGNAFIKVQTLKTTPNLAGQERTRPKSSMHYFAARSPGLGAKQSSCPTLGGVLLISTLQSASWGKDEGCHSINYDMGFAAHGFPGLWLILSCLDVSTTLSDD
jgi:hypothetical protein